MQSNYGQFQSVQPIASGSGPQYIIQGQVPLLNQFYGHYSQFDHTLYRLYRDFEIETNNQLFRGSYWENIFTIEKYLHANISPIYISEKLRLLMAKTIAFSEFNRLIFQNSSNGNIDCANFYSVKSIFENQPVLLNNQYELRLVGLQNTYYIKSNTSQNLLDFWNYLNNKPEFDNGKTVKDLLEKVSNTKTVSLELGLKKIKDYILNSRIARAINTHGPVSVYTYNGFNVYYIKDIFMCFDTEEKYYKLCVVDNPNQLIQHAYEETNTLWQKINFFINCQPFQKALAIDRELASYNKGNILEPKKFYLLGDRIANNFKYRSPGLIEYNDVIMLKNYYADIMRHSRMLRHLEALRARGYR